LNISPFAGVKHLGSKASAKRGLPSSARPAANAYWSDCR